MEEGVSRLTSGGRLGVEMCRRAVAEPFLLQSIRPRDPELPADWSATGRRDCHFTGTPSSSLLTRLLKGEGDAAE